MTSLSKKEWDQLDTLLGKHGFGGYYDLVESLKIVVCRLGQDQLKPDWEAKVNDLPTVVKLLLGIALTQKKGENP